MKKFLTTKELIICGLFASLTAICSQISIPLPFTPIPLTLQVFSVFLSAIILGPKLGSISQITYVLIGAIGMPVFANMTGGLQKIAGPTGGYILSFPITALVVGYFAMKPKLSMKILGVVLGMLITYAIGTTQLGLIADLNLTKSLMTGFIPFIPLDSIKVALALIIGIQIRTRLTKSSLIPFTEKKVI
ncbi:MAG: biotin transporter BioY [Clostridium sp.]